MAAVFLVPGLSATLAVDGYTNFAGLFDARAMWELTSMVELLYDANGERAGSEFRQELHLRRLANLVDKPRCFVIDCGAAGAGADYAGSTEIHVI